MKAIYKTSEALGHFTQVRDYCDGNWVCLIAPTPEEVQDVSAHYGIELQDLVFALDEEESGESYGTVPLAIILGDRTQRYIITVCLRELQLLDDFRSGKIKKFYTYKKTRFILQILYRNATYYLQYLRMLERSIGGIEEALHRSTRNEELFKLLSLDKSLVYLSNSLRANDLVLERLMRLDSVKKYPEDEELLEDVIVENKQAIEMANVYSSILDVTMEAYSSVISNNLNAVMKILTSVTLVMTIPTMIFSFFGMNVPLPWETSAAGVWYIGALSLAAIAAAVVFMMKRKMF